MEARQLSLRPNVRLTTLSMPGHSVEQQNDFQTVVLTQGQGLCSFAVVLIVVAVALVLLLVSVLLLVVVVQPWLKSKAAMRSWWMEKALR